MHAIKELLVGLALLPGHILVEDGPQLAQNGPDNELSRLVCMVNAAFADLICQVEVLCPCHLELQLLLWIGVRVLCRLLLNLLGLADDGVAEDALAEDGVEVVVVQHLRLALNRRLDVLRG